MKLKSLHRCAGCGATSPQWLGRCPSCRSWGSLELVDVAAREAVPVSIAEIDAARARSHATGVGELDRVLGGGLVAGSVTLLAGAPGIGKSTLCLQMLHSFASRGKTALMICAEEAPEQVRRRAERLGATASELLVLGSTSLEEIRVAVESTDPDVVAVDSIQTITDADPSGTPGSVTQVRECAQQLAALARARSLATVLVGHVTKEGVVAGPRVLEHLVDTVVSFEGEHHHALRILRALKHRFASADEVGLFELGARGLVDVVDPSARLLADARSLPGSVVVPTLEGSRPLLVEIQALVAPTNGQGPRRVATGLDPRRVDQLVAVLTRRAGVALGSADLCVSAAGGVRVVEAGADLAIAAAISGAHTGRCVRAHTVALGEIGLGGELRTAPRSAKRLREAARMGYRRAVVPEGSPTTDGIEVLGVATLTEALPVLLETS